MKIGFVMSENCRDVRLVDASCLPNFMIDLLHLLKFLQQYEAIAIRDCVSARSMTSSYSSRISEVRLAYSNCPRKAVCGLISKNGMPQLVARNNSLTFGRGLYLKGLLSRKISVFKRGSRAWIQTECISRTRIPPRFNLP